MTSKTALVLGATGGIGGETARRLVQRGWRVRALHRDPARAGFRDGIDWIPGDAMNAADVTAAAGDASLIVHGVNPPGYRRWGELVLPMVDATIAAAEATGARVVLPGTVYNYGPDAFRVIDELAAQRPVTPKGRIRAEMERRLAAAAERGRATVLVVRAGDFFGPSAANSWFSQGLITAGRVPRSITRPGRPGVGHQWAYLPDVAETVLRLVETGRLPAFATFHMDGHFDPDGTRMIEAIRRAVGRPELPIRAMPWWLLGLAAPFNETLRGLREMRYLWREAIRLDNRRLVAFLGEEPRTPLDEAVRTTLAAIGSLPEPVDGALALQS